MRSWLLLAVVALAPFAGLATAGGALETPGASLVVQDGFDACSTPVGGFCAFQANASGDPGDWEVDAYQSFGYVGVAANGALVHAPERSATVRGSDLFVQHPAFRLAAWGWEAVRDDAPLPPDHDVDMSEDGVTVHYVGPTLRDEIRPMGPRTWTYEHMEGGGLGYDRAGPFLQPTGSGEASHSDTALEDVVLLCAFVPDDGCRPAAGAASRTMLDSTPDVRLGFEFHDVEVASDPDQLGRDLEEPRAPALPPQGRRPAEPAGPAGPRQSPRDAQPPAAPSPAPGRMDAPPATPPRPRTEREAPANVQTAGDRPSAASLLPVAAAVASLLVLLAIALYTRLARGGVLRQETRRSILRIVEAKPGIRFADLVEEMTVTRNAVRYHVRVLVREGVLRAFESDGRTCLVVAGELPGDGPVTGLRLQRHPLRRRLLDALRAAPGGLTRPEIHDLLADVPRRTRNHTLRLLKDHGILRERADADGQTRVLLAPRWAGGQSCGRNA